MKRREFTVAAGAGLIGLPSTGVYAQARKPDVGADYLVLDKKAPVEAAAGKIEVVEFFWYKCPHCNAFEPALEAWIKRLPADVSLRRVPVGFRDDFAPLQRLFYALEAMGQLDKLHARVFATVHVQKKPLDTGPQIADWVAEQGLDKAKFMEQYNSFSVSTKVTKATQLQNLYRVEGVPALGVAGRFYTDGTLAKNMDRALQTVDFLIGEVRAKR
jgi:protein dithiol oxidoreductase (disulfide-forming)